jgi:hypothetical protein
MLHSSPVQSRFARLLLATLTLFLAACAGDRVHTMVVSIPDQKMVLYRKGAPIRTYDVSTSKFCISDCPGSNGTPLGRHEIAKKIGGGAPSGMKFKSRRPTGEIVAPDAPGRDPIVSRILWLKGLEHSNRNSFARTIYIHGTAEECKIGTPASYGCIRMRSRDVIDLYGIVGTGAKVDIRNESFNPPEPAPSAPGPQPLPAQGAALASSNGGLRSAPVQ